MTLKPCRLRPALASAIRDALDGRDSVTPAGLLPPESETVRRLRALRRMGDLSTFEEWFFRSFWLSVPIEVVSCP